MADGSQSSAPEAEDFLARMPSHVVASLTDEQRQAIARAALNESWSSHPVNIRFSLPLWFRRFYVTLVAGPERRTARRRHYERVMNPLGTRVNLAFVVGVALAIYGTVVIGILLYKAING